MPPISQIAELFRQIAECLGVIAFAVSGAMIAIERDSDLFGVTLLGVITALGGGVIRDSLLGIVPPLLFVDPTYLLVSAVTGLVVFFVARSFRVFYALEKAHIDRITNVFDAIGLGVFSVLGVRAAQTAGYGMYALFCVFLGVVTGCGGGLLRDVMTGSMPVILYKRIYAVASLCGAALYYYLPRIGVSETFSMPIAAGSVFVIRMLATRYKWNFPHVPR